MRFDEDRVAQLPDLPPLPAIKINDDELRQVRSSFVPPEGYEAAKALLTPSTPVQVLIGRTGSGKRTMALRLLWERSGQQWDEGPGELAICELLPDWEEPDVRRLPAEPRHGYLLDFNRDSPNLCLLWTFAKALRNDYSRRLTAADSYLVLTVTDEQWQLCKGVLDRACFRLPRTAARSIVERRTLVDRRAWLHNPLLDGLLATDLRPAEAVRLADAISRATGEEGPAIEHAVDEFRRWRRPLAGWFREHPSLADRTLMTAAAVLDGSSEDEVCEAATALLRILDGDAQPDAPLAGPGRTARFDALRVEPVGTVAPAGSRPDLQEAVVDYVLDEYPELIPALDEHRKLFPALWRWLEDSAMVATDVPHRVARVAQVLAGRSIRRARPIFLDRVPQLADSSGGQRTLARMLLEQTVLDPVIGGRIRRWIRLWAGRDKASESLTGTIAAVCSGALGAQLPTVALTTLRRILVRRDLPGNELAALDAVAQLAGRDGHHRRLVLTTIVRWMTHHHYRYAGGMAFLRLMQPGPDSVVAHLTNRDAADPQVFWLLRIGWQRLGDTGVSTEQVTGLIQAWVAAARRGELPRDVVADLLVLAMEKDIRRMAAAGENLETERMDLLRSVLDLRHRKT